MIRVSREQQIAVGAQCMNIGIDAAEQTAQDLESGLILIESPLPKVGAVVVAPDLSTMFVPPFNDGNDALEYWRSGQRTPVEEFALLWQLPSETVGRHSHVATRDEKLSVAAGLLNGTLEAAAARANDMEDGIVVVSSEARGAGSVLIGPDLSTLFFPSYVWPQEAVAQWRGGRRTPKSVLAEIWSGRTG
ncbi:Uncharacterised protein [Mycolicibacterium phlei]|nr:Uncharacterised protein [Mycolicibacterium phlei]